MFESAEVGSRVSKEEYEAEEPQLRLGLINAQYALQSADFPVIIVVAGDDRPGCADIVDLIHEWMDARFLLTNFFGDSTEEERQRPRFWRYWRDLPPNGRIGVFLGAWTVATIGRRLLGRINASQFDTDLAHVHRFEEDLASDGALILKFWIHLPKHEQQERFKKIKKNPDRAWRISKNDWRIYRRYDKLMPVVQHALRKTSTVSATWNIVEGTDARFRDLAVMKTILDALTSRLEQKEVDRATEDHEPPIVSASLGEGALSAVDLEATIPHAEYKKKLTRSQARLSRLAREAYQEGLSSVLVFEGWDAAGKGGVIRRITRAMSAQTYRIMPIAAPTDEEKAHHYLWRFWRRLPRAGRMLILDRSWYGRVLVERVEGFAQSDEWQRAYEEINDFEEQLVEHGTPVLKFWLHIDPDEQLRRFREREKTPYKKYKITEEDYRNRQRWDDYVAAVNEMVARTSTELAPWTLVPANDKRWARLEVLRTVNRTLKRRLKS